MVTILHHKKHIGKVTPHGHTLQGNNIVVVDGTQRGNFA